MSGRVPLPYTSEALEPFRDLRSVGPVEDTNAVAAAGSATCGDVIGLYLKVMREGQNDDERAGFESCGCAANIAAASVLTGPIKGRSLKGAWQVAWRAVAGEMGRLPTIRYYCSILAVGAPKHTKRTYYDGLGKRP